VGHYAAGARLIGLTEKQLQKHMEKIRASNANSTSPYAQPLYNLNPGLAKRARIGASPLSNCLRGKKGKIRLKFKLDDIRRKSLEAKAAGQISVSFDKNIQFYVYHDAGKFWDLWELHAQHVHRKGCMRRCFSEGIAKIPTHSVPNS
jgi:hypothetical protein